MTFYEYMLEHYLGEDSPKGDLAQDMLHNAETFPLNDPTNHDLWDRVIQLYLTRHHACQACMRVYRKCWKEYTKCVSVTLS